MNSYNFLHDKRFLQQLDSLRIKQQFIKITVLNWKEEPLEQIQGIAISGSVNLDGSSSMRRTATLSLFAQEKENNLTDIDNLFSINKKCILELGIINKVPNYTYTEKDGQEKIKHIEIDYKKLYGDIIWFPLGFYIMFNPSISHSMQGVTISMQLKDKMCLLNGDLGGEIHSSVDFSYQDQVVDINSKSVDKNQVLIYNIIKELVNHWGNQKLENIIISQVPLKIKRVVKWIGSEKIWLTALESEHGYQLTTSEPEIPHPDYPNGFESGRDIGFIFDDFVYPGQLSCNAGDTITSVLDKIIGIMGNYEYFYDVFGKFRFQQKQNYLNMTNVASWAIKKEGQEEEEKQCNLPSDVYQADYYRLTKSIYDFTQNDYTTTYNNSLNYNNIKNDFVVWGSRKSINSNVVLPCRFHLAIDKRPELNTHTIILYQDEFQICRAVGAAAGEEGAETRTSVDWREEIYYQMLEDEKNGTGQNTELNNTYFQYYAELKEEFPKIFDLENQKYKTNIKEHPEEINYFLDFIDEDSQLGCYSVSNIGRRAKIINDNNEGINCVFEPQIPNIVYIDTTKDSSSYTTNQLDNMGLEWTQIDFRLSPLLVTGGIFNSCFQKIKDLLYQYTHVNNTISITTLPIYYLEPNTRITVEDKPAGIYGDYIIQSISLPLDISSTMNINAYKALQKI